MKMLEGIPHKIIPRYTKVARKDGEKAIRTFLLAFCPYPVCNAAVFEM